MRTSDDSTPRAHQASGSSRLLATMAMLRARGDIGKDFLSLFEPFILDRLAAWPDGEPVEPDAMAKAICHEFGIPTMPVNVARLLLRRRAINDALHQQTDGKHYVVPGGPASTVDLAVEKTEMLARMNRLAADLVAFAADRHGETWTEDKAIDILLRFTDEFGADLALAKRHGVLEAPHVNDDALIIVHAFAHHALLREPEAFDALEAMVRGTIVVNTLYFKDVGHISNKLPRLRVYLDTSPLLRALGLAPDALVSAAREMLTLLGEFEVQMFVFPHTITEMKGVLAGIVRDLRRGTITHLAEVGGPNREAIDALVARGDTASEIEELIDELEGRLRLLGVNVQDTPGYKERTQIDEQRFDEVLGQVVAYRRKATMEKDVKSVTAVHRLRAGARPASLGDATPCS